VNAVFDAIAVESASARRDGFRYEPPDRFPIETMAFESRVRFIAEETVAANAERVAEEIVRLVGSDLVRDRVTGVARAAKPADVAILFRSRDSHREFEAALERRGVATYVYKGLGFFEADEIQDAVADRSAVGCGGGAAAAAARRGDCVGGPAAGRGVVRRGGRARLRAAARGGAAVAGVGGSAVAGRAVRRGHRRDRVRARAA